MKCVQRARVGAHITRLPPFRPSQGEIFYLRSLLSLFPARSYDRLKTVDGHLHSSFQQAAAAAGLFATESEGEHALMEAIATLKTPYQLRVLFVNLLSNDCLPTPGEVWMKFKSQLSYDFFLSCSGNVNLAEEKTRQHLSSLLEEHGLRLSDYGIDDPLGFSNEVIHELERWGGIVEALRYHAVLSYASFTAEQKAIFDEFTDAINHEKPLCIFLDGKAGRGKTYLIDAILSYTRGNGKIALATATSAFAALLYPGGRTAHSTFKV